MGWAASKKDRKMTMITAEQMQQVLNSLPAMNQVEGDNYRVVMREYPKTTPHDGQQPCNESIRFFEFMKSGHHWVLVSVPPFW
jgi:hypothetical protein